MAFRVLIIDDDVELRDLVADYLTGEGFTVETASGEPGDAERAVRGDVAIVVLDVMLPGANGFDILRRIRVASMVPVLMLTAKGDALDRVLGLELGADDYLAKPFNPQELAARLRAILRRTTPRADNVDAAIAIGDLAVDPATRGVTCGGAPVALTTVEFDVLLALVRVAGKVVSREALVRDVLGREFSPFDRAIDTHIYNLRRKIGADARGGERIKGIRGVGYQYALARDEG